MNTRYSPSARTHDSRIYTFSSILLNRAHGIPNRNTLGVLAWTSDVILRGSWITSDTGQKPACGLTFDLSKRYAQILHQHYQASTVATMHVLYTYYHTRGHTCAAWMTEGKLSISVFWLANRGDLRPIKTNPATVAFSHCIYPMVSLYPMESLDLNSRYMSLSLRIKTGAQSRGLGSV